MGWDYRKMMPKLPSSMHNQTKALEQRRPPPRRI